MRQKQWNQRVRFTTLRVAAISWTLTFGLLMATPICAQQEHASEPPCSPPHRVVQSVAEWENLPDTVRSLELVAPGPDDFARLCRLGSLNRLVVRSPKVFSLAEARLLGSLEHLRVLELVSMRPTLTKDDRRFAALGELLSLEQLHVLGSGVSELELIAFCAANQAFDRLTCPASLFTRDVAEALMKGSALKSLTLHGTVFQSVVAAVSLVASIEDLRFVGEVPRSGSAESLASLTQLQNLRVLELPGNVDWSALGTAWLLELPSLHRLEIVSALGLCPSVGSALNECSALRSLVLYNCVVDDEFFVQISASRLTSLEVRSSSAVGLAPQKRVSLPTDAWLHHISRMTGLTRLWLDECGDLTPKGISYLSELRSLECLILNQCYSMNDRVLGRLGKLQELKEVRLSEFRRATAKGVNAILALEHLEVLSLRNCRTLQLSSLQGESPRRLRKLVLDGCASLTVGCYEVIASWRSVEVLHLVDLPSVTSQVVVGLAGSLSQLRELKLISASVDNDGVAALAKLSELRALSISYCKGIDVCTVIAVARACGLTDLYVYGGVFQPWEFDKLRQSLPECQVWDQ